MREAVERAGATAFHHAQRHEYVPGRVTNAQDAFRDVYAGGRDRTVTVERVATNGQGMFMRDGNRVDGPGDGVVQWYGQASASTNVIELSDRAFAPTPGDDFSALQLVAHELGHMVEGRHRRLLDEYANAQGLSFVANSNPESLNEALADIVAASTLPNSYTDDDAGRAQQANTERLWARILDLTYPPSEQQP